MNSKPASLDMFPPFSKFDIGYRHGSNPVFPADDPTLSIIFSYFKNLLHSKPCPPMAFAPSCSPLLRAILYIISLGTQKQMMRIYAPWCIATMKNAKTFWDRASIQFPRSTVCFYHGCRLYCKKTVTSFLYISGPQPTARHWFHAYKFFESFENWLSMYFSNCFFGIRTSRFSGIMTGRHAIPPYQDRMFRPSGELNFSLGRFINYIMEHAASQKGLV